jgi:hypothetical protein
VNYFDQDEEFKDVLSLEGLVAIDPNERDLLACMGFADTKEAPLVNYIYLTLDSEIYVVEPAKGYKAARLSEDEKTDVPC